MNVRNGMTAGALVLALGIGGSVQAAEDVDLELSLSIDSSGSISTSEFNLQMQGYKAAFLDPTVQASIAAAPKGVAVNVVFFASSASVGLPFQILRSEADATAFANTVGSLARPFSGGTAIDAGINLSTSSIFSNDINSDIQIIDVSTDGVPNSVAATGAARDAALAAGVDTINGLAIGSGANVGTINTYVIGGTGAQTFVATSFADFEDAVIKKIRFEVSRPNPNVIPTPTAAFAGLALLGVVGARRRRAA